MLIQSISKSKAKIVISLLLMLLWVSYTAKSQDYEKIFRKGVNLYKENKFKEALIYIDSSLNIDSSAYQRYSLRSDIKISLGMLKSAAEDMTRCIEKCDGPNRMSHVSDYYMKRAEILSLDKNQNQAFLDIHKSIEFNPKNWKAYTIRSSYYLNGGNLYNAMLDLDKSISINDNEANTYVIRGELRAETGDISGACKDFRKLAGWGFDEYNQWLSENCK